MPENEMSVATKTAAAAPSHLIVARSPAEMERSRAAMLDWVGERLLEARADASEIEATLDRAVAVGWSTKGLDATLRRAQRLLTFYEKVEKAIEAGYYLVPNFDVDVVAVRTSKKRAPEEDVLRSSKGYGGPRTPEVLPDGSPAGEGRFVHHLPTVSRWDETIKTEKTPQGETFHMMRVDDFRDPNFPLVFAKPMVMEDIQRAMKERVFDELAISPSRANVNRGDPMVIGRIVFRHNREERRVSFLVTWFLDLREL